MGHSRVVLALQRFELASAPSDLAHALPGRASPSLGLPSRCRAVSQTCK